MELTCQGICYLRTLVTDLGAGLPWAFLGLLAPWALGRWALRSWGPGAAKTETAAQKTDTLAKQNNTAATKTNDAGNVRQTDQPAKKCQCYQQLTHWEAALSRRAPICEKRLPKGPWLPQAKKWPVS